MAKAIKATKKKIKNMDPYQENEKTLKRKFFDLAT
jgi:hypothetical protein